MGKEVQSYRDKTRIFVSWRAEKSGSTRWARRATASPTWMRSIISLPSPPERRLSIRWNGWTFRPCRTRASALPPNGPKAAFSLCASSAAGRIHPGGGGRARKDAPALRLTMRHYRAVSLFLLVLFLVFTGLTAYNFYYQSVFAAEGYTIPKAASRSNFFRSIYNNLLVGKNPATVLLLLLVPVTAVLLLLCAFFGSEYFATRRLVKQSELRGSSGPRRRRRKTKRRNKAEQTRTSPDRRKRRAKMQEGRKEARAAGGNDVCSIRSNWSISREEFSLEQIYLPRTSTKSTSAGRTSRVRAAAGRLFRVF